MITSRLSRETRIVRATFTGLADKTKYSTNVKIHFRGGKIQQTKTIQTSTLPTSFLAVNYYLFGIHAGTFDVQDLSVDSVGRVCLTVCFAQGSNSANFFLKLECTTRQADVVTAVIEGGTKCIDHLPSCTYTVSVTDVDASDNIYTNPALTYHGLVIPTSADNNTRSDPTLPNKCSTILPDQDAEEMPSEATTNCSYTAMIILIASSAMLITTVVLNVTTTLLCLRCHIKRAPRQQGLVKSYIILAP